MSARGRFDAWIADDALLSITSAALLVHQKLTTQRLSDA
jgi:hypothetical protein